MKNAITVSLLILQTEIQGRNFIKMIYAKCIHSSQIAKTKDEFERRQTEGHCVYCAGETTRSRNGTDTLDCVPLN